MSDSLQPNELQHSRPPCPSPTPGVHSNSRPLSQWCHLAISSSVVPFSSCPQSLPASESFPMSQLYAWGGQSIGVSASASFLLKNTQDWSPLEWTGWISLQSKGLSRVFSNTTVRKHSEILIHTPKNLPISNTIQCFLELQSQGSATICCCCSLTKSCLTVWTPWTAACQASLSFTSFWRFLKLISTESVMPSSRLIFYFPFSSCPQSYPASGSFLKSRVFMSGSQSIRVLASVFAVNIQVDFF